MSKLTLLFICFILITSTISSQSKNENGYPLITNYSPKEYGAFQANWAIAQDKNGLMYFGNDLGLLEFDGISWRFYQLPNKTTVRSIAITEGGTIYVGGVGEMGYFNPDPSGRLIFHSLMNFLPKDNRDFSDVWETYISKDEIYFNASKYIFVWNIKNNNFKIIRGKENFHILSQANGKIYAREWGVGLEALKDDSLVLLKGGEQFANERIYEMLPFPGEKGTILLGTRTKGLLKYDGKSYTPFKTEADQYIKDNLIYLPGTVLSDGNILIGTIRGGAIVIDTTGKLIKNYNRNTGLNGNSVLYTFQDQSGAIWLGTDNGISRVDYSSPVSYFDSRNNFSSGANDIIRHAGVIYVAANNGVYYLDPSNLNFHLIKNSGNQSFTLMEFGNLLLAGTLDGLFKVDKEKLTAIRKTVGNEYYITSLKQSSFNPNRVYVGAQGLWSILKTPNGWKDEGQILNIADAVSFIVEDSNGTLWIGTNVLGVFKISFNKDAEGNIILEKPNIEHFDKTNGLQSGYIFLNRINGVNYFSTADSIYKFNDVNKKFYSDTTDNIISSFYKLAKNKTLTLFQKDSLGRLWLGTLTTLSMGTRQADGIYKWVTSPFNVIAREQVTRIYAEKDNIVWFTTGSGVIRYDLSKSDYRKANYAALVRKVEVGKDSTIYFGGISSSNNIPEISFKDNSIKFNFAAASYEGKNTNLFKTFLKGFDDGWSLWSNENTKEYTNLPPGKYAFNVIAKNILGNESTIGTYSFEILPPFYRTWWAYCCYVILLGLIVFGIDRIQRRRVLAKERERTELREAKLRAESENERRKNVELLSEIGKNITANLSIENIIDTVYESVNSLMDAAVFGIGIFNKDKQRLDFPATKEKGETLPPYSHDLNDKNRPSSWCFNNKKEIFINDYEKEHQKYITAITKAAAGENPESMIYLPLAYKDKTIGVLTAQSFKKNAYNEYHLNILRNLATYTALALDNADTYRALKLTQDNLVTQEKLASLGALTAGIAHEIKNPLNFVNNFSEISLELLQEMESEIKKNNKEEITTISENLRQNLSKINQHGKRADSIVKGMLLHSRGTSGEKVLTDINDLLEQYVNLAYHGIRAQNKEFNITIEKDYDNSIEKIDVVPQDISRVFLNIINNACYAANARLKVQGDGFVPKLWVSTKNLINKVEVRIKDNGMGIPEEIHDKLFNPFFTTKPTGEGTGLGLSLSYDIVTKVHGGEIRFESEEGNYTEFIITLPK